MLDFFRTPHTWGTHFVLNSVASAWSLVWLSASCLRGRVALSMLGVEKMSAAGMIGNLKGLWGWDVGRTRRHPVCLEVTRPEDGVKGCSGGALGEPSAIRPGRFARIQGPDVAVGVQGGGCSDGLFEGGRDGCPAPEPLVDAG